MKFALIRSLAALALPLLLVPLTAQAQLTIDIIGVGAARRVSAVRWGVAGNIVWAWVLTIPASAFVAAVAYWVSFQVFD